MFRQAFVNTSAPNKERGSVIILVALALTAMLGFCAIVTDIGLMYVQKAHLQNAADAAALAGAQDLPSNPDLAEQSAEDYASQNGVSNVIISFEANNAVIVVQASKQLPTYFAQIWGISEEEVSVSSKAMMVPPTELAGAVPLSIQEQNLIFGQKYTLKSGGGSGESGWYGALELSGNGADDYEEDLENGYTGILKVGQIVSVKHGNMSGPTERGITDRLDRDISEPRNTFDSYERNAPEIVYIPVVKVLSESGNSVQDVQIVGFAAFFIEGVAGNGNDSVITGRFIKTLVSNDQTSDSISNLRTTESEMEDGETNIDYGLYSPKLIPN